MPRRLTADQIDQYQRDGYLSPIRVMSEEDAGALRREIEAFEAAQGRPLHGTQRTKSSLLFPCVHDLFTSDAVLDAVEDLIGPDILQYQCGSWFKEPETGSYVSWHQDCTYYGLDPLELVSAWVALSPATEETGCMQVVPGSHREGVLPVENSELNDKNMLASGMRAQLDIDESRVVTMALRPGEMSLHHVALVHSSRPNHGHDRRMGISGGFTPTHTRQTTSLLASALLVRGEDRYGNFPLDERPPVSPHDPATIACHDRAVTLYRDKAIECGNDTAWRLP